MADLLVEFLFLVGIAGAVVLAVIFDFMYFFS